MERPITWSHCRWREWRLNKTSVSETIRKPPLAEAQTAIGKQKNTLYGTPVSVTLPKFCEKNCFPTQNITEIGQSLSYGKTDFKQWTSAILNFKKCLYLVTWLSLSSKCAVVYQISSKSDDFSLRYDDLTILDVQPIDRPTDRRTDGQNQCIKALSLSRAAP